MKLAYRDFPSTASGPPAVVFHPEGPASIDRPTRMAQSSGMVGRVVAPFGDYAFYPSGMEVGGICWYRAVPGSTAADPISLTKAVVQATDLLDDLGLDHPALIGWGQGGVVALGAALLEPGKVRSVVCVDAVAAHLELLPPTALATDGAPPVLLAATDPAGARTAADQRDRLGGHGIVASIWHWSGDDGDGERDKAVAERIGEWLSV
ncbi:MAG: alpha/beta fold hydrolase [Acidimicrobiales bacterium]